MVVRVTLCPEPGRVGRMLSGAQRRNGELCRPNHSLSSARPSRLTPNRSPRSSRTTSRPAWRRSRRSRPPPTSGGSGSPTGPRGTCPSWWPRTYWPRPAGRCAATPTPARGGPSPATGTRSRTACSSPPAAPAAGSAAPCSARCWPGARQVIAVIADTGSDASAALHRRFGFTQAGLLSGVGRKHGRWIDTLLMQKDLEAAR